MSYQNPNVWYISDVTNIRKQYQDQFYEIMITVINLNKTKYTNWNFCYKMKEKVSVIRCCDSVLWDENRQAVYHDKNTKIYLERKKKKKSSQITLFSL